MEELEGFCPIQLHIFTIKLILGRIHYLKVISYNIVDCTCTTLRRGMRYVDSQSQ
jgi:hypothetical protein